MKPTWYKEMLREAPGEPGGGTPAPQPQTEGSPQPEPAPAGPDLSFIPADFHVDGTPDLGRFTQHYQEIIARDAQRAEQEAALKAAVPEGDYSFALPEDLKFDGLDLPEDFKLNLMTEDEAMKPLFGDLSAWMKSQNLPATASTELMTMLAKYQATTYAQAVAQQKADLAKLGTPMQVDARVSTISRILDSRLPAEEASALKAMTNSAAALKAIERLIGPAGGQTVPPTPPSKADDLAAYYATPSRKG